MSYPDGRRFEGFYENNERHGRGIFTDAGGNTFEQKYDKGKELFSNRLLINTTVILYFCYAYYILILYF